MSAPSKRNAKGKVQFQAGPPAVADEPPAVADEPPEPTAATIQPQSRIQEHPTVVTDTASVDSDSDTDSASHSIAGDTVYDSSDAEGEHDPTAVAARRQERVLPEAPVQGIPNNPRLAHASHNSEPEVGNFALYWGNWGLRGTLGDGQRAMRREVMDGQILNNPGQVVVIAEASTQVEAMLQSAAVAGDLVVTHEGTHESRSTREHFVIRGKEDSALLIACRKDNTVGLECLLYERHDDHPYSEKGKRKMARSRILVCRVDFKQNVGHLGSHIVIMGVHANNKTMAQQWPTVWNEYWDRLADHIRSRGVNFLAGDFNMSLTEVPGQLRSRGIQCDCVAWYPWKHFNPPVPEEMRTTPALGLDSCAIFYIGGTVQVKPEWGLGDVNMLSAIAITAVADARLDEYVGQNTPGQHWSCYRSEAKKKGDRNLQDRLRDLLAPSTTQDALDLIPKRERSLTEFGMYCPYLRLKQKKWMRTCGSSTDRCTMAPTSRCACLQTMREQGARRNR